MTRPTRIDIDSQALVHNVQRVRQCAPGKKIIAMVKANAYGCGLSFVLPALEGQVDALGVASLEEAMAVRALGSRADCVLFQGVFSPEELQWVVRYDLQCVVHHQAQLEWLLASPLSKKIKVFVKVNTGMNRLGFMPHEVEAVICALMQCAWVDEEIGLMTHLACADEPENELNTKQLAAFQALSLPEGACMVRSVANSAAILTLPQTHADIVRPGIMLYGVSPFANQVGQDLGLQPVMHFMSSVSAIHHCPAGVTIGYGSTWRSNKPTTLGVVPVGYGDGYPRHLTTTVHVGINGVKAPVVGRVSMDLLTIDLTHCPGVKVGDGVELWGATIPVETVAHAAETIAYELICHLAPRVRKNGHFLQHG